MEKPVYMCDSCGLMTTNYNVMSFAPLLVLYHSGYTLEGEFVSHDFYEDHRFMLCPECLDRFTLFETYVNHDDHSSVLRLRQGRTPGSRIAGNAEVNEQ